MNEWVATRGASSSWSAPVPGRTQWVAMRLLFALASALLWSEYLPAGALAAEATNRPAKPYRYLSYTNDADPSIPWSMHVVTFDRSRSELRFCTTLGQGETFGMGTVTEQLKTM